MSRFRLFHIIIIASTLVLTASCSREAKQLIIGNPVSIDRQQELIILRRQDIEEHIGVIPTGKYALVLRDSILIPAQYDDLDHDGKWDELAFLYSFKANEKIAVGFSIADGPPVVDVSSRAHVSQRKKFSGEGFGAALMTDTMMQSNLIEAPRTLPLYRNGGPAWENDKCAYRLSFDSNNSKHVIMKTTSDMILDEIDVGHDTTNDQTFEHSLKAGSVAIAAKATNGKDTLIRLGGPHIVLETFERLADGPLRALFRVKYKWEINDQPVEIIDETGIWAGQYFYETKLYTTGTPRFAQVVAGFADLGEHIAGQVNMGGSKIFYAYGSSGINSSNLGVAIGLDGTNYGWFSGISDSLSDIQDSYLVSQKIVPGEPVTYRFYCCWDKRDSLFRTEAGFSDYLKKQAVLIHRPVIMKWK